SHSGDAMSHNTITRTVTRRQQLVMDSNMGYDDGGRYALIAVSGYAIRDGYDDFGTVFSILDCDSGDEIEISEVIGTLETRPRRRELIGRVMHLNGKDAA